MRDFLRYLSLLWIVIFIFLNLLSSKIKLTKRQESVLFVLFALSLSCLAYFMLPWLGSDVFKHLSYMKQIQASGQSFFEFLFQHNTTIGGAKYASLYTFNVIRYVISLISKNGLMLSAVCVMIDYSIVGFIFIDWYYDSSNNRKANFLPIMTCFSFMPYIHAVSGIRNALSASLMALGIYLYLCKKKSVLFFIILSLLAATVHAAAIITIPFVFIARLRMGGLGYFAVFVFSYLAQYLAQWMRESQILYFRIVGNKYYSYTSEYQYRASQVPLYVVIFLIIIFLAIYFFIYVRGKSNIKTGSDKIIYDFCAVYMVYILGNIGNYDMILRPAYVLGPLSPVLCSLLFNKEIWNECSLSIKTKSLIRGIAIFACMLPCILLNYIFLSTYGKYFFT